MMTRECGALYLKEKRYRLLLKLWEKERGGAEERSNPNHDPKTGRFTSRAGLDKSAGSGIIGLEKDGTAGNDMHYVGKIDKKIYRCVTEDITTDEVVLTDVQIEHIKERHPNDFEDYSNYVSLLFENPDYIIEANKPNSALVTKSFNNELYFKSVLRLNTSSDDPKYKNSVITFMKIDKREYVRLIKNKKILYKKE